MIYITDGKKTAEISMILFDGTNNSPDMTADVIDYNGFTDALYHGQYVRCLAVSSVDDVIDYGKKWERYEDEATLDWLKEYSREELLKQGKRYFDYEF